MLGFRGNQNKRAEIETQTNDALTNDQGTQTTKSTCKHWSKVKAWMLKDVETSFTASKFLIGSLALNMIIQAIMTMGKTHQVYELHLAEKFQWYQNWFLVCYIAWIAFAFIGGAAGLYAAWKMNKVAARVCCLCWGILIDIQVVEIVTSYRFATQANSVMLWSKEKMLAQNAIFLIALEIIFLIFVFVFTAIWDDKEALHALEMTRSEDQTEAYKPLIPGKSTIVNYGSESVQV